MGAIHVHKIPPCHGNAIACVLANLPGRYIHPYYPVLLTPACYNPYFVLTDPRLLPPQPPAVSVCPLPIRSTPYTANSSTKQLTATTVSKLKPRKPKKPLQCFPQSYSHRAAPRRHGHATRYLGPVQGLGPVGHPLPAHSSRGHHHQPPDRARAVPPQQAHLRTGRHPHRPGPQPELHGLVPVRAGEAAVAHPPLRGPGRVPLLPERPAEAAPQADKLPPDPAPQQRQRQPADQGVLHGQVPARRVPQLRPGSPGRERGKLRLHRHGRHCLSAGHLAEDSLRQVRRRVQVQVGPGKVLQVHQSRRHRRHW